MSEPKGNIKPSEGWTLFTANTIIYGLVALLMTLGAIWWLVTGQDPVWVGLLVLGGGLYIGWDDSVRPVLDHYRIKQLDEAGLVEFRDGKIEYRDE
jgi:hypothetical protein